MSVVRLADVADLSWCAPTLELTLQQIAQSTFQFIALNDRVSLFALYEALDFSKAMCAFASQAGFNLEAEYANAIHAYGDLDEVYDEIDDLHIDDQIPFELQRSLNAKNFQDHFPAYDPSEPMLLPEGVENDLDEILSDGEDYQPQSPQQEAAPPMECEASGSNADEVVELSPVNIQLKDSNQFGSVYANDLAYQLMDVDPAREVVFYKPNLDRSLRRGRKRAFSEMEDEDRTKLTTAIQRHLYMSATQNKDARNQLSALMIVREDCLQQTIEQVSDLGYNITDFSEQICVKQKILFLPKPNTQSVTQYREMVFQASHFDARVESVQASTTPSIMASFMATPTVPDSGTSPHKKKKSRFDNPSDILNRKLPLEHSRSPILTRSRQSEFSAHPELKTIPEPNSDDVSDTLSLDAQPLE